MNNGNPPSEKPDPSEARATQIFLLQRFTHHVLRGLIREAKAMDACIKATNVPAARECAKRLRETTSAGFASELDQLEELLK